MPQAVPLNPNTLQTAKKRKAPEVPRNEEGLRCSEKQLHIPRPMKRVRSDDGEHLAGTSGDSATTSVEVSLIR